ncbi:unnamed protein product [Lactuca saligna]|uniref:Uncharacterized protein n=1 Tax=Lactuca saligna TaxID=75948 RepID=A0AA35ZJ07_LACSI|nr:unnamed protein product [Lactuca saligna]
MSTPSVISVLLREEFVVPLPTRSNLNLNRIQTPKKKVCIQHIFCPSISIVVPSKFATHHLPLPHLAVATPLRRLPSSFSIQQSMSLIKGNPKATSLKTVSLLLPELCAELFDGNSAYGNLSYATSQIPSGDGSSSFHVAPLNLMDAPSINIDVDDYFSNHTGEHFT